MPTITFYATDEVAKQLERVIIRRSKKTGTTVSRGDLLVPHIRNLYKQEFPKNGNGGAHFVGQPTATEPMKVHMKVEGVELSVEEEKQ
jgi:hypothetical protein